MDEQELRIAVAGMLGVGVEEVVKVRVVEARPPFRREDEVVVIVRDAPGSEVGPKYVLRMSEMERGREGERERGREGAGATELAVKLAADLGMDLGEVLGTGKKGRVTVGDIRRHNAGTKVSREGGA